MQERESVYKPSDANRESQPENKPTLRNTIKKKKNRF